MAVNSSSFNATAYDAAINFRYVGIVIGVVDIVLGTFGNLLTIIVFKRSSRLQLSFNTFVISLAVIDLLTASLMMPFNVAGYVQMTWPLGGKDSFTASLQAFNYFCCGYTSICCLVAITVNRYVSIRHRDSYSSLYTSARVKFGVVVSWLIAPAFLLPVLLGRTYEGAVLIGWRSSQFLCTFVNADEYWKIYMQVLRVIFQFLPIVIMICLYTAMFCTVEYSKKRRDKKELPWELDNTSSCGPTHSLTKCSSNRPNLNDEEARIADEMVINERRTMERRLLRVSAVICLVFLLLFIPSLVVNLLPRSYTLDVRIHMIASNISWLNSCVNPFIYAAVNPKFRVEYLILLKYVKLKLCGKI